VVLTRRGGGGKKKKLLQREGKEGEKRDQVYVHEQKKESQKKGKSERDKKKKGKGSFFTTLDQLKMAKCIKKGGKKREGSFLAGP